MLDFTIKTLVELYTSLSRNGYKIITVSDFFQKKYSDKVCILKHDIDRGINNALRLAQREKELNISASYYFRYPQTFNENIIKEICNLNHEIGYHYEVLAKAEGDYEKAIDFFKNELEEFRKIIIIKTICAHGSPLSKWDNKKLWEKYDFKTFSIIGDANVSFDFSGSLYLTDTGRCWNNIGNIRDRVDTKLNFEFKNTQEIIYVLNQGKMPDKIMLNIHPNRWSANLFNWTIELVSQNIKNLIKEMAIK